MSDDIQPIVMPKWGLAMKEGMVAAWHVEPGAEIAPGQEIADIETSKIANVFESPVGGPLRRILVAPGDSVPVGALLAVVAPAAVADAALDAYVAEFQERFAAMAAEAGEEEPEPETVEAGGLRLRYLALGTGEGEPVVLIHGYGGDLNNWLFNQPELAAGRSTYALDLPGHGGSSKELPGADVPALAKAVLAFLDAKGVAKAHLVGHSLGGAIALLLALEQPGRVAGATLICPAGLGAEINMEYIDGFIAAKRGKQLRPVLEMLVADPELISRDMLDEVLRFKRLDGVERALAAIRDAAFPGGRQALRLEGRLGEVKVPLQVIWGSRDRILPAAHADGLPQGVPVHRLEAGHLTHMEKAAEVNRLIAAFLDA